jgi:hypothetical protein
MHEIPVATRSNLRTRVHRDRGIISDWTRTAEGKGNGYLVQLGEHICSKRSKNKWTVLSS